MKSIYDTNCFNLHIWIVESQGSKKEKKIGFIPSFTWHLIGNCAYRHFLNNKFDKQWMWKYSLTIHIQMTTSTWKSTSSTLIGKWIKYSAI